MHAFLTVSAVVGPFVGIALGVYLTMLAQKRHWVLDSRKEEYRELMGTLTQTFYVVVDYHSTIGHDPDEQRAVRAARLKALAAIGGCLSIHDEVKRIDVLNRWRKAVHRLDKDHDTTAFATNVGEMINDIVNSAKQLFD
jgi:hypothetical protein